MKKNPKRGGARAGAGRKRMYAEGPTVVIAASVPSGLVERLDAAAKQRGWNRSAAIIEAVRGLLKRLERKPGVSIPPAETDPSVGL